jgi:hypothetical protein
MAVSYDTWRRAHGFSESDAPDPTEFALRLVLQKGMITPELTESMLASISPEIMGKIRDQAMQNSGAAIPPEIDQILSGDTVSPTPEADAAEAPPAEPAAPLAEPEV